MNDPSPAGAGETARCVQTNVLATAVVDRAFINVLAVRPETRLLITVITDALISAHHVLANAVRTYTAGSRTLVDVLARLLVWAQLVSRRTLTAEAPFGINTSTTATQTRSLLAFVYV